MNDQDLNSSEIGVAPQENEHDVSMQSEPNVQAESQAREEAKERDWRAVRQRQKEMEYQLRQKDEVIERMLRAQPQQPIQKVEDPEIPDDEPIVAGMAKGIAKKTIQPLERKIQDLELKLARQEQDKQFSSLRSKYSDFDDVVNVETLELLEKQEPELAASIAKLDQYTMALQSYKYIKALNLVANVPEARRSKEVINKMEKNAKAVQSPQAYDKRPMAQAYKLTQADQTKIYEEMMHYASKASGL